MIYKAQADTSVVRLIAEFDISGTYLHIRYVVRSKTVSPIVLFDAPQRLARDGNLIYDAHLAYVSKESATRLAIKRIVPPLPRKKMVEMARGPLARRLPPGGMLNGEIRIELPAREYSPYYPPTAASSYRAENASDLKFTLEYAIPGPQTTTIPIAGLDGLYRFRGTDATFEVVELSIYLSEPIPVMRRTDDFEPI